MIQQIELVNFRKFERFSLRLRQGNILVGPNNSGKSSILDAFRILEACCRHARGRNPRLMEMQGSGVFDGYEVPESVLPFRLANTTYNYSDDDAVVEFYLTNGARAVIRLNPEKATRFYVADADGARLTTSTKFLRAFPVDLVIVPTLSPLEADEPYVQDETVRRNAGGRLASRHLRNMWLRESVESFESFRKDVEEAWKGVRIHKPELTRVHPPTVSMFFSEDRRDREVQWAGFGFQVWLQIQTHLRRGNESSILIIDEPDIYLHPDLQRRLLRNIRNRFSQFFMATHSVELVNDADANEIISISAPFRTGRRVKSEKEYQTVYQYLGSSANADLARIARARRAIFVEGKDGRVIRRLATRLGFRNLADASNVPIIELGGFSRWRRAADAAWAFKHVLDLEVRIFCIFDRDYRSDDEVNVFCAGTHTETLEFRVLGRKEIENYLLVPSALQKAIGRRLQARGIETHQLTESKVDILMRSATEDLKSDVLAGCAANALRYAREQGSKLDQVTILKASNRHVEESWDSLEMRLRIVPGKETLSRLNDLLQIQFAISVSEIQLMDGLTGANIDPELLEVLKDLDAFSAP